MVMETSLVVIDTLTVTLVIAVNLMLSASFSWAAINKRRLLRKRFLRVPASIVRTKNGQLLGMVEYNFRGQLHVASAPHLYTFVKRDKVRVFMRADSGAFHAVDIWTENGGLYYIPAIGTALLAIVLAVIWVL